MVSLISNRIPKRVNNMIIIWLKLSAIHPSLEDPFTGHFEVSVVFAKTQTSCPLSPTVLVHSIHSPSSCELSPVFITFHTAVKKISSTESTITTFTGTKINWINDLKLKLSGSESPFIAHHRFNHHIKKNSGAKASNIRKNHNLMTLIITSMSNAKAYITITQRSRNTSINIASQVLIGHASGLALITHKIDAHI